LVIGLKIEIKDLRKLAAAKDSSITNLSFAVHAQAKTISADAETKQKLNAKFDELYDLANKKTKWFQNPFVIFTGGLVAGIIISKI
jgi:NRPS condensation-like uncharacterized protein